MSMVLVYDAGSLVFVWEDNGRVRMILHAPDVRSTKNMNAIHQTEPEPPPPPPVYLTPAELSVLPHLVEGLSNIEIAAELESSAHTIKFHITNICHKLNAKNRVAAATTALRRGLVK